MRSTIKVLPSISGKMGCIQLNNQKVFHALNTEMIHAIQHILSSFSKSSLKGIILTASPHPKSKIFCAGGDVKSVYLAGMGLNDNPHDLNAFRLKQHGYGIRGLSTADFFREEYRMNYTIANLSEKQPLISIWDGIVFGGGVGISILGQYRICTENTLFAMPETGIGLFPDVGSTFFLNQLKGSIGLYLALSGTRLKSEDLIYSGLATHFVPAEQIEELIQDLSIASTREGISSQNWIDEVLTSHHVDIPTHDCYLAQHHNQIDETFGGKLTMEDIVSSLKAKRDDVFSRETLQTIEKMSPTSLKVTLEGMIRGQEYRDIGESLKMEYRMSQNFMKEGSDFYEGIRATLIDKDKSPKWFPASLEEVNRDDVIKYFHHLGDNELTLESIIDQSKL